MVPVPVRSAADPLPLPDRIAGLDGLSGAGISFAGLGDVTLEAALTALALIGTLVAWSVDRLLLQRRRLAYRVQMDTPLHVTPATDLVDVELRRHGTVVPDASLVLLRIENAGGKDLEPRDIHHPVSFTFPGRRIVGLEVTKPEPEPIKDMLLEALKSEEFIERDKIVLPKIAINRRDSFKLFVLLTGTGTGVKHSGFLFGGGRGGGIRKDTRARGPLGRGLAYGAVSAVLVGVLVGYFLTAPANAPDHCVAGRLAIVGSTAFEPVVKELRGAYLNECAAAEVNPVIDVSLTGSRTGARTLFDEGQRDPRVARDMLAVSDGPADPGLTGLQTTPVAILVFAVVVNDTAGVTSMTSEQLRAIYAGQLTNWSQLGGNDRPIKMVSRIGPDSGSRRTFQDKALGGALELGITSDDCESKDDQTSTYYRCEVGGTTELLDKVNQIDGAIGYAELTSAAPYPRISPVSIDDQTPEVGNITDGGYRFWAVEYALTYGPAEAGSLLAAFLGYLTTESAGAIFARGGVIPCQADTAALCDQG